MRLVSLARVGLLRLAGPARAALLACGAMAALTGTACAADGRLAVIVSANGAPAAGLSLDELGQIYRRRQQFMGSARAQPINLPAQHPLRRFFSQQVLHKTPEDLEDYWRDQYFNGVSPPFVLASEEAMIRFVASTPGAVGYVSLCLADKRVAVVFTLDGGPACSK
jgi:ABC-type phosphate transport system substrate-binding protein